MKGRDKDLEDFARGVTVRTPSGVVGVVEKHQVHSKRDHFDRIVVRFGPGPRDTITLQPKLLELVGERTVRVASGVQMELDIENKCAVVEAPD